MIIHFMREDCLNELKANVAANIKHYSEPTNEWIYDFLGVENPFVEFKVPVDDFQFVGDEEMLTAAAGKFDVENAIRLYSAMKNLTPTQATDERLWAGLCHGDFWDYMHLRWKDDKNNFKGTSINNVLWRYFLYGRKGSRRALISNTLSRYWWLGYLTYDVNRKDPFEFMKYWGEDFAVKNLVLFSNNFMGNRKIARGLIAALLELKHLRFAIHGMVKRDLYYQASQYLNVLGGLHILDYYSEEEIKDKVIHHMKSLVKQQH